MPIFLTLIFDPEYIIRKINVIKKYTYNTLIFILI